MSDSESDLLLKLGRGFDVLIFFCEQFPNSALKSQFLIFMTSSFVSFLWLLDCLILRYFKNWLISVCHKITSPPPSPYLQNDIYECSSSWQVTVTFDTSVSNIDPHAGAGATCSLLSKTCSFTNASWNGAQNKGVTLAAGFTISFGPLTSGTNPNVVSITLNGQIICSASIPSANLGIQNFIFLTKNFFIWKLNAEALN